MNKPIHPLEEKKLKSLLSDIWKAHDNPDSEVNLSTLALYEGEIIHKNDN